MDFTACSHEGQLVLKNIPTLKCDLGEMGIVCLDVYITATLNSGCLQSRLSLLYRGVTGELRLLL